MFTITYARPYTGRMATQSFRTMNEAERMIAFYASCGVRAHLV